MKQMVIVLCALLLTGCAARKEETVSIPNLQTERKSTDDGIRGSVYDALYSQVPAFHDRISRGEKTELLSYTETINGNSCWQMQIGEETVYAISEDWQHCYKKEGKDGEWEIVTLCLACTMEQ